MEKSLVDYERYNKKSSIRGLPSRWRMGAVSHLDSEKRVSTPVRRLSRMFILNSCVFKAVFVPDTLLSNTSVSEVIVSCC